MSDCYQTTINNETVVIPNCLSVVISLDILDCTCNEQRVSIIKSIERLNNRIDALGDGFYKTSELKKELTLLKRRLK